MSQHDKLTEDDRLELVVALRMWLQKHAGSSPLIIRWSPHHQDDLHVYFPHEKRTVRPTDAEQGNADQSAEHKPAGLQQGACALLPVGYVPGGLEES